MMIGRRQWMAGGAALGATLAAGPLMAKSLKSKPIGIQLYTVRELFSKDPMGTLEKVAAIGYREVEYGGGGYDKMDHAALRKTMDRLGLTSPSIHVAYEALASDFDGAVAMTKALGADTLVVPYIGDAHRTAEGWKAAVANFNRYAERLKKAGLGFAYHNHDFEFILKPGGTSLFDTLITDADPALVRLELDLFWAVAAGEDPKAIIRRLPGRIYAYHVKDRTADGKMTSVGKGVIDFADIFTLNAVAGVKHFYVENDQSPAPYLPDIQTSFTTLSRLRA
ncbi:MULTISPECIES: sugar phosphate isomerase/epimerase [unclassified Sphingopyxis]|uniref:sugar phosphate isomerase/epimerase family protein n=1 Tax=unclassified Sphingopyxis TaxID=2614943 RepID=UPI002861D2C6|nr:MULTISPECIES: sugar phosphate isomerase/epimerase [unclassified Sphingopyxis]MDR7059353.1 sugar phosphate isomerase/epimerase [Sphingopyxis sp. BE235]MDR7178461.1 sugar phosphate isomerase/epimerase [Sphingopyxis sp. BE249]